MCWMCQVNRYTLPEKSKCKKVGGIYKIEAVFILFLFIHLLYFCKQSCPKYDKSCRSGRVIAITSKSGHYKPNLRHGLTFLRWLGEHSLDMTKIDYIEVRRECSG